MCYYDATGKIAGDEVSSTYEGRHLTIVEGELTHPSHSPDYVNKGDPVLHGENIVGVAFKTAAAATDLIAIDTEGIWFLSVVATEYGAVSSAVAYGDEIFINKSTAVLSKNSDKATQQRFGYALGPVTGGATAVVAVKVHWNPDDALERVGTSAVPMAINTVDFMAYRKYYSTTAVSGTTYGDYTRVDAKGAGSEVIAMRPKVLLTVAAVGNAHGSHSTLETDTSAGSVTGLGTGLRANLVLAARALPAGGTYYGAMAEIFCNGSGASIAASSKHAVLEISVDGSDTTALNTIKNAISFDHKGTDGTGQMICSATDASPDWTGSIRILVNGAVRYLHFTSAEAT
jgi:hypothetical protein